MGGGVSSLSTGSVIGMDTTKNPLISERLLTTAKFISRNYDARKRFIAYLFSNEWVDEYLDGYDKDTPFSEVKYVLPSGRELDTDSRQNLYRSRSSLSFTGTSHTSRSNSPCVTRENSRADASKPGNILINASMEHTGAKLPLLLLAGILNIFCASPELRDWLETNMQAALERKNTKAYEEFYSFFTQLPQMSASFKKSTYTKELTMCSSAFFNVSQHMIIEEQDEDLDSLCKSGKASVGLSFKNPSKNACKEPLVAEESAATDRSSMNTQGCEGSVNENRWAKCDDRLKQQVVESISRLSEQSVDKLLKNTSWLSEFVSYVENLPLNISIASSTDLDVNGRGYPLTYVNKGFETMSQYNRTEILNLNASFLYCNDTELGQLDLLNQALCERKGVKLALTNVRKNGSAFCDFVAMKPVINRYGQYTHVMSIHYELEGHEESYVEDFVVINDLMRMLPSILY